MECFDVVVLGAGAAGLFAAMRAGQRGRRVLLLDHADEAGKKILISGGGRCNFTNTGCVPERFISADQRFARAALAAYRPADFVALVQKHGIAFHEKTLGQLFCDGSARQIVAMLLAECEAAGVVLRLGERVGEVAPGFRIGTARGRRAMRLAGAGDRRAVDPEDGGHRARPPRGPAIRPGAGAHPGRPGATDLRRRGPGADAAAGGRCAAGDGDSGQAALRGGHAVHPSRLVGACGAADQLILAPGRAHRPQPAARRRCGRGAAGDQARAAPGGRA